MKSADDIVVVAAARTPFDAFGGPLRDTSSIDLAKMVIVELLQRSALKPEHVNEVNVGQCIPAESCLHLDITARQALLRAGLPVETLSSTVDRACCSATTALQMSMKNIILDESEISLAVGAENMSHTPFVVPPKYRWEGARLGEVKLIDPVFTLGYDGFGILSVDAGDVALEYGITREMQDEFAYGSQQKYQQAKQKGAFDDEIFPVEVPGAKGKPPVTLSEDTQPRPQTTLESLAKLKTVYGSPTVTAGNAPGLNAGASGVVIMKRKTAEKHGLEPMAVVRCVESIARHHREIAVAPAPAMQKALAKTGLSLDDLSLIEINEAFAAVPLVSTKILSADLTKGRDANDKLARLRGITNVNGGAIAIGHPVGATGIRLVMTLINELKRRGGGIGAVAICGGLAQADCAIIEVE